MDNIGYLIWEKIPYECLHEDRVDDALKERVQEHIVALKQRRIGHVRTGISWAEWDTPGGRRNIDWYVNAYCDAEIDVLPDLTYTPPRLGLRPWTNSPPRDVADYATFVHEVCSALGDCFTHVELWNEWNLITDWDTTLDPDFIAFNDMISLGALVAKDHGKKVVLGGMAGVREQSLSCFRKLVEQGLMGYVDVVGFHALRGTWSDSVPPPSLSIQAQRVRNESLMPDALHQRPHVWLTEYGFPPHDPDHKYSEEYLEEIQVALMGDALEQLNDHRLERVYWYTLRDHVTPSVRFIVTGLEDTLQYYYGDTHEHGRPKLLGRLLMDGGPERVLQYYKTRHLSDLVDKASLMREQPKDYRSQDNK